MNNELNAEQLKKIEFGLLCGLHAVCQKLNLRYSMSGGTLLGAVRHKGFIPWDDDIDVLMPRPDYDKFIAYCLNNQTPFGLKSFETDEDYVDMSAKIYDRKTVLVDNDIFADDKKFGVYIDIFPVDGLGNTYKEAVKAFKSTSFKRNLLIAAQWKKFKKSKTHGWYYEPFRFAFYVLSRCVNKAKVYKKILKKYEKYDFDKVNFGAVVAGSYRLKEIMPREVFSEYILLPFESGEFYALKQYDKYLSGIFGDYMQLPPEEKRVSHHSFKAYYVEEGAVE